MPEYGWYRILGRRAPPFALTIGLARTRDVTQVRSTNYVVPAPHLDLFSFSFHVRVQGPIV